jgi:sortase (surface protein transpeptidase)
LFSRHTGETATNSRINSGRSRSTGGDASRVAGITLVFVVAMAGFGVITAAFAAAPDPPTMPSATSIPASAAKPIHTVKALAKSTPTRVDIAAIGVDAPIFASGVDKNGDLAVPPLSHPYRTNWYKDGPTPGQVGNAVILGHVDSKKVGAAVFYRLGQLTKGNRIDVTRSDGTVAVFQVTGVALYAKTKFPATLVFAPAATPGLRLITCGGSFDAKAHTYRGNIIVTAEMVSSHRS